MTSKICTWHLSGVPTHAMGKRWFAPRCPSCEKKRDAGLVSESDPTPEQLFKKAFGARTDDLAKEYEVSKSCILKHVFDIGRASASAISANTVGGPVRTR